MNLNKDSTTEKEDKDMEKSNNVFAIIVSAIIVLIMMSVIITMINMAGNFNSKEYPRKDAIFSFKEKKDNKGKYYELKEECCYIDRLHKGFLKIAKIITGIAAIYLFIFLYIPEKLKQLYKSIVKRYKGLNNKNR